jgi:hypothetical protein
LKHKLGSALRVILCAQSAAMPLDNAITDGQTQARAFANGFGGEKWLEYSGRCLRGNARSVVVQ